ncbi:MAG: hypothetical protein U5L11_03565 [Arhodomonas sp.]|nr:hypothetical protein [Arhodomonas sp.]
MHAVELSGGDATGAEWRYALRRWEEGRIALASYTGGAVNLDSPDFKAWLADSLFWIGEYHREVACALDPWAPGEARFLRFFSDLVTARSRSCFFRENPNTALNLPLSQDETTVGHLAEAIGQRAQGPVAGWRRLLPGEDATGRRRLRWQLAKYAFKLPPLYEVLFSDDEAYDPALYRRAVFLDQAHDRGAWEAGEEYLDAVQSAASRGAEAPFRQACRQLPLQLLHAWLPAVPADTGEGIRRAYARALAAYVREPVPVEPFAWHAAMILWKVEGLLQDAWEQHPHKHQVLGAVARWLEAYRGLAGGAYREGRVDYNALYDTHSALVGALFALQGESGALYPWVDAQRSRELLDELDGLAPLTG